ncbi:MAG: 6,7-dimethyl-8-ribityllumazine synthase, partial [Dongiaceae bacterium]
MTDKPHILIVEARFYDDLLHAMLAGAKRALDKAGATYDVVTVPGALEIPGAIKLAHEAGDSGRLERRYDGYVAIGCVIRGETT